MMDMNLIWEGLELELRLKLVTMEQLIHPQMNMTNEAVAYLLLLMNGLQPQFQNVTSIPELNTKIQQIARHAIEDVRRATVRSGNDINTARNAFYEYIC